jgi:hypothetical protein
MSTLNQYGYSTQMNPKIKNMLDTYRPKDKTRDADGNYFKKSNPLWTQNSIERAKLKGSDGFITRDQQATVCGTLLVVIIFLWALFNL